ncbi:MAG TPA: hypothetical protein VLA74_10830 [Nitrososphaeraceae archaeon]|nr:hypothetical protein [Nitrososphaeraceae archaeon]
MSKEKNKILDSDTNTASNKLKKFTKENNNFKKNELFNVISETDNPIYFPLFEELTVMQQLKILRYTIDSMESLMSGKLEQNLE